MTEIRFYHLTRSTVEQALPELLEKVLARGWRGVIRLKDEAAVEALNAHLWVYRKESFLPHGASKDGNEADQPLWLTEQDERPNNAEVLFQVDGAQVADFQDYTLVCDVFDGNDSESVAQARTRWTVYKKDGHTLTYWQQAEKGWTKKGE